MPLIDEIRFGIKQLRDGTVHAEGRLVLTRFAAVPGNKGRDLVKLEGMERVQTILREEIEQEIVTRVYGPIIPAIRKLRMLAADRDPPAARQLEEEIARLIGRVK